MLPANTCMHDCSREKAKFPGQFIGFEKDVIHGKCNRVRGMQAIDMAKERGLPYVAIFEDDFAWQVGVRTKCWHICTCVLLDP
jgi:hypothetical protein